MKSSRTWTIVTVALLLSGCSDSGSRGLKDQRLFTDFDVLTIKQSACLFDCPVFEVKIFSDGRVRHSGPAFEHTGGEDESRIDGRGLVQIAKALRDTRIDEMRDSYQSETDGCESQFTDMPTLSLNVRRNQGYWNKNVVLA
jgi:hypothetical protein